MKKSLSFIVLGLVMLLSACSTNDANTQIKLENTTYVYYSSTGGGDYIRFTSATTCEFYSKGRTMIATGNTTSGRYSLDGTTITFFDFVGGYYVMPKLYTWINATLSSDGQSMYATYLDEDGKEKTRTFQNRGY